MVLPFTGGVVFLLSKQEPSMKILQLAPIWETVPPPGYGGTEAVVSVLTEELVRRGHEVLLCASGDSITSADLFSVVPRSLRLAEKTSDALQYTLVHVAESLKLAAGFDVVHNHNGPPADIAMAFGSTSPPMLTTLHNQPIDESAFIWNAYRGWYNAISDAQADSLPPLEQARFAGVVHNAIDVETFPFRCEKEDYLLFMARLSPEKAPHLAIEAARLAGRRLIIAGKISTADERAYFDSQVAPLLGSDVVYVGEASAAQKRELYAGAQAQLIPLLWEEPFGLVAIEAMACGTPAIAFRRGAMPELIDDGRTGFLVEDTEEMAAAIEKLGGIDALVCRQWVKARFSPEALADKYLQVYNTMLDWKEVSPGHFSN